MPLVENEMHKRSNEIDSDEKIIQQSILLSNNANTDTKSLQLVTADGTYATQSALTSREFATFVHQLIIEICYLYI